MKLVRRFSETTAISAEHDPAFRVGLLEEAIDAFLEADLLTGKRLLRDYVDTTRGFEALGHELGRSPKSLMRMLSHTGNPRADNLFTLLKHLEDREGVTLRVRPAVPLDA